MAEWECTQGLKVLQGEDVAAVQWQEIGWKDWVRIIFEIQMSHGGGGHVA